MFMTLSLTARARQGVLGLLLATGSLYGQTQDGLTQQDVVRELRQLKLLVLQQGIELQNMKVASLEWRLTELQRTDEYVNKQAREFNEYLSKSDSDPNAQTEGTTAFLENLQASQRQVRGQTAELETQLQKEKGRLEGMVEVFGKEQAKTQNRSTEVSQ
jgi:hypothetical protein